MKKIPTMFDRDWNGDRSRVLDKPNPNCAWVFAGEGWPTQKIDGTSCMIKDGALYKRRELRAGDEKPEGFIDLGADAETGKAVGWVPVGDAAEDQWHREAFDALLEKVDGTYELVGPKIQGNPERATRHGLMPHYDQALLLRNDSVPRDFEGLKAYFAGKDIEGIVFHHVDGRMAKIKMRDFGLKRPK